MLMGANMQWHGSQVQVSGVGTTRENIAVNELLLKHGLQHLGSRPSVQTCMLHIQALYSLMQIDVPGYLAVLV